MFFALALLACAPEGDAERGATLYADGCASCHGDDGAAGITGATDLGTSVPESSDDELMAVIQQGKGDMGAVYSDETDAMDVVAYLRETF